MTRNRPVALALTVLVLVGCAPSPETAPRPEPEPMPSMAAATTRSSVTDLAAFEALISTRPSPTELRSRYPGLQLVLPGDISTRELRGDRSRYFVELDAEGRVMGGRFQ